MFAHVFFLYVAYHSFCFVTRLLSHEGNSPWDQ